MVPNSEVKFTIHTETKPDLDRFPDVDGRNNKHERLIEDRDMS
jgi:hypothetical protein